MPTSLTPTASDEATIVSVDLPGGQFGGGYPDWKKKLFKGVKKSNQKMHLLKLNSHHDETFKKVVSILGSIKIDLLFIDGDHSYKGVKSDFEMYSSLVSPGGFIAFHDIVPGPEINVGGVPVFWEEVKGIYSESYQEFVDDWSQVGKGISLIKV